MSRISFDMSGFDALVAIGEGNPGAIRVCAEAMKRGAAIDPDSALGGLGGIFALDTHKIYGSRVWQLYKDVCGEDLVKMLAVLRAVQLGIIPERDVTRAIDGDRGAISADDLLLLVQAQLPRFGAVMAEAGV